MPRLEMAETKPVEVTEKWQMGNERFTQRATYGWENLPFDPGPDGPRSRQA